MLSWTSMMPLNSARGTCGLAVKDDKIYVSGGLNSNGSAVLQDIEVAKIDANGNFLKWTAGGMLPTALRQHGFVSHREFMYVFGGLTTTAGGSRTAACWKASIVDGQIGKWTSIETLPVATNGGTVVALRGYFWFVGGGTAGGTVAKTYRAKINSDGSIQPWLLMDKLLPNSGRSSGVVVADHRLGRMYWVGGLDGTATARREILMSQVDADGNMTAWSAIGMVTSAKNSLWAAMGKDELCVVGGFTSAPVAEVDEFAMKEVQLTTLVGPPLPVALSAIRCGIVKNFLFTAGGQNGGGSNVTTVYRADIQSDQTVKG